MAQTVLAQDQAQVNQSQFYLDYWERQKQYETDKAKFDADQAQYEKDLAAYNESIAKAEAEEKAEREAAEKAAAEDAAAAQRVIEKRKEITAANDAALVVLETDYKKGLKTIPTHYFKTTSKGKVWTRRFNSHIDEDRRKITKSYLTQKEALEKSSTQKLQVYDYQKEFGNRTLRQSEIKAWQSSGRSLSSIVKERETNRKTVAARRKASSIQSAQSAAIKSAEQYSTNPATFAADIRKFGAQPDGSSEIRTLTQKEIKRRTEIKPLAPSPPPTILGHKTLTKSQNRRPYVGVSFVESNPVNKTNPTDQDVINNYLHEYKSTKPIPPAVLEGVVKEKGVKLTPEGKQYIRDITATPQSQLAFTRTSTYTDPNTGESFDAKEGRGSVKIASALGYTASQNVPKPEVEKSYYVVPYGTKVSGKEVDFSKSSYADLVDRGVVKTPETLPEKAKYYVTRAERPLTTILTSLGMGDDYYRRNLQPSTFDRLLINVEQSIKKEKPISQGLKETGAYAAKDPLGVAVEAPLEIGMAYGGGKALEIVGKGIVKVTEPVYKIVKPYLTKQKSENYVTPEGKIKPDIKRQKQLTKSQVNTPFEIKEVKIGAAAISDTTQYIGTLWKLKRNVKLDKSYQPAKRANEIDMGSERIAGFTETKVKLPKGRTNAKDIPKKPEVVKSDSSYKVAGRANEISLEKGKLIDFKSTKVSLDKAALKAPERKLGTLNKPVKEDPKFTPSRDASEIKESLIKDVFTKSPIQLGKSQGSEVKKKIGTLNKPVKEDPKYEPSRDALGIKDDLVDAVFKKTKVPMGKTITNSKKIKKKKNVKEDAAYQPSRDIDDIKRSIDNDKSLYGIKETKTDLGSSGLLSGSKQSAVLITKKVSETSKKKLQTKRRNPTPTDYATLDIEKQLPKGGAMPITILKKSEKKKRKDAVSYGAITGIVTGSYYVPESYGEISKQITMPIAGEQTRIDSKVKIDTKVNEKLNIQTKQKSSERLVEKVKLVNVVKEKQKLKQKQFVKSAVPSRPKPKTTVLSKPTNRPKKVQKLGFYTPPPPKGNIGIGIPADLPDQKKSKVKVYEKPKEKTKEFIGNTQLTRLEGLHKRKTLTYGIKKVKKLAKKDLAKETKRFVSKSSIPMTKKSDPMKITGAPKKKTKKQRKKKEKLRII